MSAARNLSGPWKPGQSGNPSGRPKRVFPRVDQILFNANLEPIAELMKLLPTLSDRDKANVWMEILPYVHAKAKPADDERLDPLDELTTAELISLVKTKVAEIG